MDKNKVVNLAQSFSVSCKQMVKENQIAQKIASPQVASLALAILVVVATGDPGFKSHLWASV